jgi:hypothetical protein
MPSCPGNPQDPPKPPGIGSTAPQGAAPRRSEPSQKRFTSHTLQPISQTEAFRKRSTTLRLPALNPDGTIRKRSITLQLPALDPAQIGHEPVITLQLPALDLAEMCPRRPTTLRLPALQPAETFHRRPTTLRLPALDPAEMFHTRATPPRLPALGQAERAENHFQQGPAEEDLWLIGGPGAPGRGRPATRRPILSTKSKIHLALLAMVCLLLLGAQGFIANVKRNCWDARDQPNCLVLNIFPASSAPSAPQDPALSPTPGAGLPTIPADLPANVQSFIVIALPYAVQAHDALGWPISVLLAQWGLEHGWSVPDAQGYNWGNTEYAPGCPYQGSRFCYASTPAEGLREYIYAARLSYYDGVRAAVKDGAAATALALGESPWDTGHYGGADHPGASLLAIMSNFNFYRFDSGQ